MKFWIALLCAVLSGAAGCARPIDRLRSQAEELRALYEPFFGPWLTDDQAVIAWPEFETIARMEKAPGHDSLTYFNRYLEVRWSRNAQLFTSENAPYSAAAMNEVRRSTSVVIEPLAERGRFDVYIPFVDKQEIQGILLIRGPADGLALLVANPRQYIGDGGRPPPRRAPSPHYVQVQEAHQLYLSGVVYFQKGDTAKARDKWKRALTLDPGYENLATALARTDPDAAKTP